MSSPGTWGNRAVESQVGEMAAETPPQAPAPQAPATPAVISPEGASEPPPENIAPESFPERDDGVLETMEDFRRVFEYDAFAPGGALAPEAPVPAPPQEPQPVPAPAEVPPVVPPVATPEPPVAIPPVAPAPVAAVPEAPVLPTAVPAAPATPAEPQSDMQQILAANRQLMEQNRQLMAQGQNGQQAPAAPEEPAADPLPDYDFALPDNLVNAIGSDDAVTRQQGLKTLVRGIGQAVHAQLRTETAERVPQMIQTQVNQAIQSSQQQSRVSNDFYTRFPQLNREDLRPFVQQATVEVMREQGVTEWSPLMRDAIGQRTMQRLAGLSASVTGQPQQLPVAPAPTVAAPAQVVGQIQLPPEIISPGASPAVQRHPYGIQEQVRELMFTRP